MPRVLTLDQVCTILALTKPTVMRLIHAGEIPATRVGRSWRVREDRLLERLDSEPTAPIRTNSTSPEAVHAQ